MSYLGNSPGVASQRVVTTFVATDGQTNFVPQSGYTLGYLDVYRNGIKLINGVDYTADNGTDFTLTSGAAADDSIEAVSFTARGLSDGYTKAEADTRFLEDTNSGVTAGSYGSSSQVPVFTVDSRGLITSASETAVAGVSSTSFDSTTGVLTINTSDGGSHTADLGVGTADSPTFAAATVNGNIIVTGTVDGRDVAVDGTKLDSIENGATADQTGAEIKAAYEGEANTNAFTDAEKTKLSGIEAGADVTDTANVTAAGALMDSELTDITAVKALNQGVSTTDAVVHTGLDLSAIAASKADTAVDVFVYDTRKDSDGGAWRKRTQHTSWYNETLNTATRGARREFPAVAVIVAEAENLTIYDGDDPDLPMWMVFDDAGIDNIVSGNAAVNSSCAAINGVVCLGQSTPSDSATGGVKIINFARDDANQRTNKGTGSKVGYYKGSIEQRNDALGWDSSIGTSGLIVNMYVNDIAMTVLPNAPIDPATQLPIPTIAVATDGGVSVIKDDGSVVDITHNSATYSVVKTISFDDSNKIIIESDDASRARRGFVVQIPSGDDTFADSSSYPIASSVVGYGSSTDVTDGSYNGNLIGQSIGEACNAGDDIAVFSDTSKGLSFADYSDTSTRGSLLAYITSTYNTGWMNGDIKLATLSDTDDTDVTGSEQVGNNLTANVTDWGATASNSITWNASGYADVYRGGDSNVVYHQLPTPLVAGKRYTVSVNVVINNSSNFEMVRFGDASSPSQIMIKSTATGVHTATFTASANHTHIWLYTYPSSTTSYKDLYVRKAEEDRSVNNNGLQVFGTVTKTPVATGADLVKYLGWSSSNYLQQPYNSDLDFGTGNFCIMAWVISDDTSTTNRNIVRRSGTNESPWRFRSKAGKLSFWISDDNAATIDECVGTSDIDNQSWHFVVGVREGSHLKVYVDGRLENTTGIANATGSLDSSDAETFVGVNANGLEPWLSSITLLRISATAPTAEQIAKIYEDEKVLFQEGAQATLYGSSDAVTALAYDDTTELLHVGTSAGRSDFSGLRRVSNTTDAVGTAISASNGLIAEE